MNGETSFPALSNNNGASLQYPIVFGTYDPTDMTNFAKWNKKWCTLDFSNIKYTPASPSFFTNAQGHTDENYRAFFNFILKQPNASVNQIFYLAVTPKHGVLFEQVIIDGCRLMEQSGLGGTYQNLVISALTSVGTAITATVVAGAVTSAKAFVDGNTANPTDPTWALPNYYIFGGDGTTPEYVGSFKLTGYNVGSNTITFTASSPLAHGTASGVYSCTATSSDMLHSPGCPVMLLTIVFNQVGIGYSGGMGACPLESGCTSVKSDESA